MRLTTIAISLALLTQPVPALAQGGFDLTWDNCVLPDMAAGEPTATVAKFFDCESPQAYELYGCFKTPVNMPAFHAMDVGINVYDPYNSLPLEPFWHFETGGCNAYSLTLNTNKLASGGCGLFVSPWGPAGGGASYGAIVAYYPDYQRNGFGRILIYITRAQQDPFPLLTGVNYYALALHWYTSGAGQCAGCDHVMAVYWDYVALHQSSPGPDILLSDTDKGNSFQVIINDKSIHPIPVAPITWGQIKSQYR